MRQGVCCAPHQLFSRRVSCSHATNRSLATNVPTRSQLSRLRVLSLEGTAIPAEKQEAALGTRRRAQQAAHAAAAARDALRRAQEAGGVLSAATGGRVTTRWSAAEMLACRSSPFAKAPARLGGLPPAFIKA